jgi:hypothetical protein
MRSLNYTLGKWKQVEEENEDSCASEIDGALATSENADDNKSESKEEY